MLFRLPELMAADSAATIYLVEGEKDTERLRAAGKIATGNVGGAGKWRDAYSEYLRGRPVAILPDADNPGREHAAKVAASLLPNAKSIKIVELPGLLDKGDVSDWLDAGHSIAELDALVDTTAAFIATDAAELAVPLGRTEAANARRFALLHGADVRWCEPWHKWVTWDGRRWMPDVEPPC